MSHTSNSQLISTIIILAMVLVTEQPTLKTSTTKNCSVAKITQYFPYKLCVCLQINQH